jgi:hypothetical protein
MKTREKEEARKLRHDGYSVKDIARKLYVSLSSASLWVRDVPLTEEQRLKLQEKNPILGSYRDRGKAARTLRQTWMKRRMSYQEKGREMALSAGQEFAVGCALYWAEGTKSKNQVGFSNSDKNMVRFFIGFLRQFFLLKDDEFSLSITCYLGNGLSFDEIKVFWLKSLSLPESCLRKCFVDHKPSSSHGTKTGKLPYGVVHLRVNNTEVVQKIFGAIKQIGGFDNSDWID